MKKLYATLFFALMAMTSFAQEQNDTTYVMFDFNLNPWNYPVSTAEKGWGPDYDDETGAIFKDTDFTWPITEGSSDLVTVTCYAVDLDEYTKPAVLCRRTCVNAGIQAADGSDSIMTMLFTNPGTTMRFKAPEGYKFGKMLFYNYRSANFLVGDEYEETYINDKGLKETFKVWVPESPKVNQYDVNIWEGDATNILFNYPYFSAHFMKIDMRLVSDGSAGIKEAVLPKSEALFDLQGRRLNAAPNKGLYIVDGKKIVK